MSEAKPYPYQEEVAKMLLAGTSVVLQAPTGAGKTRAALLPFLHAWSTQGAFPTKCIYVVPMRVLANQFVHEYNERVEHYERLFRRKLKVTIQTGDQPKDKRFEGDLIFCTIDQFLSSYLTMPYSLSRRLANLNAGAMVGAYVVFDEFHLLDPSSTLPTALYVLKQVSQIAPVLVMTATFSESMLEQLAKAINATPFLLSKAEARQIDTRDETVLARQRTWQVAQQFLNAETILSTHKKRSLVLCNTVVRAQTLYRQLRDLIEERNLAIRLLLLHSRFLPEDRQKTETDLRSLFGKDADSSGSFICIATQAIEVGVDISSEILHTELAPASSLIQRAGRCARYPGQQGQVIVYPVENFAPYGQAKKAAENESLWVQEMRAALAWLQANNGTTFDFATEQALVNAVATPRDQIILLTLSAGSADRKEAIHKVLNGDRSEGDARLLVRDADSCLVLIHPDPDQLLENPYGAIGFSLQRITLFGMVKEWLERDVDVSWRVKLLLEDKDATEDNRTEYGWQKVLDTKQITGARVLVVNSELAGYLQDEGFVADVANTSFYSTLPANTPSEKQWEQPHYRLESYEEHIGCVLTAFQSKVLPQILYPAAVLEHAAGWRAGTVIFAAWLACLLHDVGKLSVGWQGWARTYQTLMGNSMQAGFAAAHTDHNPKNSLHKDAEKAAHKKQPKPHHAGESALASCQIIINALNCTPLSQATITAITRHHTSDARECQVFTLQSDAHTHIKATIGLIPAEVATAIDLKLLRSTDAGRMSFSNLLSEPADTYGWMAYTLLARALRLSDQAGTEAGMNK